MSGTEDGDGEVECEEESEEGRPEWPPTQRLLSELADIGGRVRESSLSTVWREASESAASRLFEWWVSADEELGGAEVLFEERQVRTTGGSSAAGERHADDEETDGQTSGWAEFVTSAGGLLEASRRVGAKLASEEEGADDEWERALWEGWQQLRDSYPELSEVLLRRMIEQSDEQEQFESPGRTVATSEADRNVGGPSSVAGVRSLWTAWLSEESGVEMLADRAVAVAFREVFVEEDPGAEELKAAASVDPERASGFMRALERIMMRLVESAFFEEGDEFPSGRKDERGDQPNEETDI